MKKYHLKLENAREKVREQGETKRRVLSDREKYKK